MAIFEWSNDYSVGNAVLDQHHKNLIKLFNDAYDIINQSKPFIETNKILSELSTYAVFHFHEEEKAMKNADYKDYEKHKKAHKEFTDKINEFRNSISIDNTQLNEEIFLFLYNWLINHIQVMDKQYSSSI